MPTDGRRYSVSSQNGEGVQLAALLLLACIWQLLPHVQVSQRRTCKYRHRSPDTSRPWHRTGPLRPSARHSVEARTSELHSRTGRFLRLIESQRQILSLEDGYYDAVAEYHQRLAELDRQTGGPPLPSCNAD